MRSAPGALRGTPAEAGTSPWANCGPLADPFRPTRGPTSDTSCASTNPVAPDEHDRRLIPVSPMRSVIRVARLEPPGQKILRVSADLGMTARLGGRGLRALVAGGAPGPGIGRRGADDENRGE